MIINNNEKHELKNNIYLLKKKKDNIKFLLK